MKVAQPAVLIDNRTRAAVVTRMWGAGRPCHDQRFANVYVAGLKAGLDDKQSYALACIAHDAAVGWVSPNLTWSLGWLRKATLERLADNPLYPRSLWRYLRARFGGGYTTITDAQIEEIQLKEYQAWHAWAESQSPETVLPDRKGDCNGEHA